MHLKKLHFSTKSQDNNITDKIIKLKSTLDALSIKLKKFEESIENTPKIVEFLTEKLFNIK